MGSENTFTEGNPNRVIEHISTMELYERWHKGAIEMLKARFVDSLTDKTYLQQAVREVIQDAPTDQVNYVARLFRGDVRTSWSNLGIQVRQHRRSMNVRLGPETSWVEISGLEVGNFGTSELDKQEMQSVLDEIGERYTIVLPIYGSLHTGEIVFPYQKVPFRHQNILLSIVRRNGNSVTPAFRVVTKSFFTDNAKAMYEELKYKNRVV